MRYANIKRARQDDQQHQTTTNINYTKNFVSVFKKQNLIAKSK